MATIKAVNGRKIQFVCTFHGLQYGVRPTPDPQAEVVPDGLCDICEEIGDKNTPKACRKVEAYIGIRKDPKFTDWKQPII